MNKEKISDKIRSEFAESGKLPTGGHKTKTGQTVYYGGTDLDKR